MYLAMESSRENGLKGGRDVSEALRIPLAFMGKILQELARDHIISSVKGPGGGFYLSGENLKLPIIKIVETMGDISYFNSCGLGLSECSENHPCPIHDTFKISRDSLLKLFSSKSIGELSGEIEKSKYYLVG